MTDDVDSREKLEAEIFAEYTSIGLGPNMSDVLGWLDRQAAITERECLTPIKNYWKLQDRIAELESELQARELYPDGFESAADMQRRIAELEAQVESWRGRNGCNMAIAESLAKQELEKSERIGELESLVRDMRTVIAVHEGDDGYEAGKHFDKRMRALGIEVE